MNINDKKRHIIFLTNLKSPQIEQAIFIMRDGNYDSKDAVNEAEKIVNEYLSKKITSKNKHKKRTILIIALSGMLLISGLLLLSGLY